MDEAGLVGGIALVAEKGGRCRFEQPCRAHRQTAWCTSAPAVRCDGVATAVEELGSTDYAFNATVGARCTISPGK